VHYLNWHDNKALIVLTEIRQDFFSIKSDWVLTHFFAVSQLFNKRTANSAHKFLSHLDSQYRSVASMHLLGIAWIISFYSYKLKARSWSVLNEQRILFVKVLSKSSMIFCSHAPILSNPRPNVIKLFLSVNYGFL